MIIVVLGPTCSGKSKVAVEVAKHFGGQIINADAFQIYKGMDIGTAKPKLEDRIDVIHHLFDIKYPDENYSIADYQKDSRAIIDDLLKKEIPVVIVGGSNLYVRAALFDYNFETQNEVDLSDLTGLSNEDLHKELEKVDKEEADKIHKNNRKRVLRAIEIYRSSGISKSVAISLQNHKLVYDDVHFYAIDFDRKELYDAIDARVDKMVDNGLIKEAYDIIKKYGKDIQALKAIGYREIAENDQMLDTESLKDLIKKNTRNYAKRQVTFIKHQFEGSLITSSRDIILDIQEGNINSRSFLLLGESTIHTLSKKKVAVVGLGGVGGTALEALVRSGITNFELVDGDTVNPTNLNRQILYTKKDIDEKKVKVAKRRIKSINSDIKVKAYDEYITVDNVKDFEFEKCDFVIDAIDSMLPKISLICYLITHKIPFVSSLGMGNRLDPSKVIYTTLDKTTNDPLARKLRHELKAEGIDISKVNVVSSLEVPLNKGGKISSMIFVPSSAGLLLANKTIDYLKEIKK